MYINSTIAKHKRGFIKGTMEGSWRGTCVPCFHLIVLWTSTDRVPCPRQISQSLKSPLPKEQMYLGDGEKASLLKLHCESLICFQNYRYRLNVYIPQIQTLKPNSQYNRIGRRASGRCLMHDCGAPLTGVSTPIKESPSPLRPCEDTVGAISGTQPSESNVWLRPSGRVCDSTTLRPLYKLKILVAESGDLLIFWQIRQTSYISPLAY